MRIMVFCLLTALHTHAMARDNLAIVELPNTVRITNLFSFASGKNRVDDFLQLKWNHDVL